MKRNKRDTTDGDETPSLPDSIVMHEILPKLPVKSLIRFQSVAKDWLAYIKNPNFVKLHLKFSYLLRPQFLVMKHNRCLSRPFYLLPHRKCVVERYDDLEHEYDVSSEANSTNIVDSCNGLVCLYNQVDDPEYCDEIDRLCFFGLWNPTTRKYDKIDSPPGVHISLAYGFGYVSSVDDYKIVSSFATESDDDDESDDEGYVGNADRVVCRGFYVFSLRSGKWEKICGDYEYSSRDGEWRKIGGDSVEDLEKTKLLDKLRQKKGLWHEGVIYWPPCMWSSKKNIVGFDLTNDGFREYRCTDWLDGYGSVELFRLKGSLALRGNKGNGVSEFWALKDGGDDLGFEHWQKLFSVNLTKVQLITISETSKCLVRQSKQLKLVDFSKEALESCEVDGRFYYWGKAIDHVESLVSPFRMTTISEEEEGTKP